MLTFAEIMKRRKLGKYLRWSPAPKDETTAAYRLKNKGFIEVWSDPKFSISPYDKVFTIGSCFARNIEEKLEGAGINVLSRRFSLPPEDYTVPARPNAALNKFNTHSIEDEIRLAMGHDKDTNNCGFFITAGDKYFDPLASYTRLQDFESVSNIRKKISETTSFISDSQVVIITLGQNEVWIDRETGFHLNTAPPPAILKKHKDRFAVVLMDYENNISSLKRTIDLITNSSDETKKIIITVSPVPMGTTLSNMDVISANSFSKSMLRVCAQELADNYENIDYFPSYEMAMHSSRETTWEQDELHVTDEAVGFITDVFLSRYLIEN